MYIGTVPYDIHFDIDCGQKPQASELYSIYKEAMPK